MTIVVVPKSKLAAPSSGTIGKITTCVVARGPAAPETLLPGAGKDYLGQAGPEPGPENRGRKMGDFGFWAVAGGTAVAVLALLLRALTKPPESDDADHPDLAIYRAQLAEVDRDLARGVLAPEEAARLRVEVSRRLLDADKAARAARGGRSLPVMPVVAALVVVMAGGVALYLRLGAPGYPDLPINDRLAATEERYRTRPSQAEAEAQAPKPTEAPKADAEFMALMDKLRAAVKARPDDVQGLTLLARNEAALANYTAAAAAQGHLLSVLGAKAGPDDHLAAAEYLIAAAGGYISPEAEAELVRVLTLDPKNPLARYYSGLMFAQVGRADRTFELWEPLLREGPEDAPWKAPIRAGLQEAADRAGIRYSLPDAKGPSASDMQAAGEMSAEDRQAMIEGMVGQLEGRLLSDGGPEAEWLKLFNALKVLNQPERVKTALVAAETAFAADPAALDRLRAAAGVDQ